MKTKKQTKQTTTIDYEAAQARVGKPVKLVRGILRGTVTVEAYRQVYGRLEYLVRAESGEREWVKEGSLELLPIVKATKHVITQEQIDEAMDE